MRSILLRPAGFARIHEADLSDLIPLVDMGEVKARQSADADQVFTRVGQYMYKVSPAVATYHVSTRNTVSGQPWQLHLSRLLPSEARRLSDVRSPEVPFIKYDEDMTLYIGEKLNVPISIGQKPLLVIRGRRMGTLQGTIVLEKSLGPSGRSLKFWQILPVRRPLTQAENERLQALMHKRGYRTSDDWKRQLVFSVRNNRQADLEWLDEHGELVGLETGGQITPKSEMDADAKDLLVACWACKNFINEKPVALDGIEMIEDKPLSCSAITYRAVRDLCGR